MNKRVREALDKIIDREAIAHNVYKDYRNAASGPFNTKLNFINDKKVTQQDIQQHASYYSKKAILKNIH
jgi:peptide/nickel transport system substrate-binding protein